MPENGASEEKTTKAQGEIPSRQIFKVDSLPQSSMDLGNWLTKYLRAGNVFIPICQYLCLQVVCVFHTPPLHTPHSHTLSYFTFN